MTEATPQWIYNVYLDPSRAGDTFGRMSDGFQIINQNTVERHRPGTFDTDGAQWGHGFTKGKHVFEVMYPEQMRHTEAGIGVATDKASVHEKGKCSLVGRNSHSWGIDLRTKRSFYGGQMIKKYPVTQLPIPGKFYMYLDCDAGKILFGSDFEFYGTAASNIRTTEEIFPMVSACVGGASVTMIYRGEGYMSAEAAPGPSNAYGVPKSVVVQSGQAWAPPQQSSEDKAAAAVNTVSKFFINRPVV